MPNLEGFRQALDAVVDPTFGRSMVALGLIKDIREDGGRVKLTVRLTTPAVDTRAKIEEQIRAAARSGGFDDVDIDWKMQIPTRQQVGDDPTPSVKNIILVMSGKGGVGKSTVAANLALALARSGTRVGLLDADIYGPSVPTMFGISGNPTSKDGVKISPLERFGLKLMSIGFMLENDKQAIVWRGPMLHGALNQFFKDVDWGDLDYLILDCPPGTGDVALTVAQKLKITGAVIVTTPQEVALQDVYKSVSMCVKLNIPVLGVVENMSHFVDSAGVKHELFGAGGGEKIAQFAQAPLFAKIPLDPVARKWADEGIPVVQAAPDSEVAKALRTAADELANKIALVHFELAGSDKAPAAEGPKRLRIVR